MKKVWLLPEDILQLWEHGKGGGKHGHSPALLQGGHQVKPE